MSIVILHIDKTGTYHPFLNSCREGRWVILVVYYPQTQVVAKWSLQTYKQNNFPCYTV